MRVGAFFLLGIYGLYISRLFIASIEFEVNRSYITETFCVNKLSDSSCQGKCYFSKKMKKLLNEESDESSQQNVKISFEDIHTVSSHSSFENHDLENLLNGNQYLDISALYKSPLLKLPSPPPRPSA